MRYCFLVYSVVIYVSSKNESVFPATLQEHLANCWYLRDIVYACFLRNNVRIFLLTHRLIKTISRNDSELRVKNCGGSAKNRYFSRLFNDWRNMFININKKNCLLIFFKMFLKPVKMGWQFQATLKFSVYLIHFKIFF